ncbi:MAG: glutamate--tRNA ligase family protein, partial [Candidatus Levybacteria bacterium]|nr:glutamate--tRNA ligase family protein [Candidatus Levybacteria bacterium]
LEFRKEGFLPEAILNYMALLGWTPPSGKEITNLEEMIKNFDLNNVHTTPAVFDIEKLKWLNGEYIRKFPINQLRSALQNFAGQANLKKVDKGLSDKFIPLAQTRMTTLNDFYEFAGPYLEETKIELNQKEKEIAQRLLKKLSVIEQWDNETILSTLRQIIKEENIRMPVIYKIITGKERGLPLPESLEIFGWEKTLERLKKLI